ncbi:MAG: cytochrome d ubiquinol oxidase subunit II [Solirubrobacterales bacterium]
MSKPEVAAAILWLGATLYAVFGGADFGAGILSLFSRRDAEVGARARRRIQHSLGPVWEANHVWLIFCLVVLWTAFPKAFGPLMETLYVPLTLALIGIILRGSGFAFGHTFSGAGRERAEEVFAASSLMTPFFMGCVVGAIADGAVPASGPGEPFSSWLAPLPLLVGALFVTSSAYIAAVFLTDDAGRAGETELVDYFRRKAIGVAIVAGALALVGLVVLRAEARFVFDGLVGEALPLMIASLLLGGLALVGLLRGAPRGLRPLAVGAVVAVIWGWAIAQHPYLFPTSLTIDAGAGAGAALSAVIIVFGAALLTVIPSLAFLYWLSQRQLLE